jgi:hypothetical protein
MNFRNRQTLAIAPLSNSTAQRKQIYLKCNSICIDVRRKVYDEMLCMSKNFDIRFFEEPNKNFDALKKHKFLKKSLLTSPIT